MKARNLTLQLSASIIWRACQHLPPDMGDDRLREWTAELPFILDDSEVRPAVIRMALALWFAVDQHRTVQHLPERTRYSWADAGQDVLFASRLTGRALLIPAAFVFFSCLWGIAASFLGGLACVIGACAGILNGQYTEYFLIGSSLAGGVPGGIAGGFLVARGTVKELRERWQKWYAIRIGGGE